MYLSCTDLLESGWMEYFLKGLFVKKPYPWKDYHFETNGNLDYFIKIAEISEGVQIFNSLCQGFSLGILKHASGTPCLAPLGILE